MFVDVKSKPNDNTGVSDDFVTSIGGIIPRATSFYAVLNRFPRTYHERC